MKKIFPLVPLFIMFGFTGCNRDHDQCLEENTKSIEGLWELRKASSMLTIDYPPGNGRTIKFSGTKYEMRENGRVTQSGEFSIVVDATASQSTCLNLAAGQYTNRIIYDNNTNAQKLFFQLAVDKLTFISGCFAVDAGVALDYDRQ
jgi:hypothetical protein